MLRLLTAAAVAALLLAPAVSSQAADDVRITRYAGTALKVTDMERAEKFLTTIGFKPALRPGETGRPEEKRYTITGQPLDTMVNLLKVPAEQGVAGRGAYGMIVLDVTDAAAMHKRLADAGYKPEALRVNTSETKDTVWHSLVFVNDLEGYRWEFIQRPSGKK